MEKFHEKRRDFARICYLLSQWRHFPSFTQPEFSSHINQPPRDMFKSQSNSVHNVTPRSCKITFYYVSPNHGYFSQHFLFLSRFSTTPHKFPTQYNPFTFLAPLNLFDLIIKSIIYSKLFIYKCSCVCVSAS